MSTETTSELDEARASLERIQSFDTSTLTRQKELGAGLNFAPALESAQRLVDLWKRLATSSLEDFPQQNLVQLKDRANHDFSVFESILNFTTAEGAPNEVRRGLIEQVGNIYQPTFHIIHPLVAYSLHRSADFQRLESDARTTLQGIRDEAGKITAALAKTKDRCRGRAG